jgi:hypothetical protein
MATKQQSASSRELRVTREFTHGRLAGEILARGYERVVPVKARRLMSAAPESDREAIGAHGSRQKQNTYSQGGT